jgi:hypothetical protein
MNSVREILNNVRNVKGMFHLSFSNIHFYEIQYLPKLLEFIIDEIKNQHAFVATCSEITDWMEKRNRVKIVEEINKIRLTFLDTFSYITFEIIGARKVVNMYGCGYNVKGNFIHFTNVIKGSEVEIVLDEVETKNE